MARAISQRPSPFKVVEPLEPPPLAEALADPDRRKEVRRLTQQLVDIMIEMMDLVDGDPDQEPNGDEFEDDGGI